MKTSRNLVLSPVVEAKQQPVATFKNSLRVWQERYKAQLAARSDTPKPPRQAASA
jgi:hypothetical protein